MNYEIRTLSVAVMPEGKRVLDEGVTKISIDDEGGGEYVVVSQQRGCELPQSILIDPDEWPTLRDAIHEMLKDCRE